VCRSQHRDIGAGTGIHWSFQWAEVGAVVLGAGEIPLREIRLPFQSQLKVEKSISAACPIITKSQIVPEGGTPKLQAQNPLMWCPSVCCV
jgi:hypothetical protein